MKELIQKNWFKETIFEITDNSLHFKSKGLFDSIEYDVSFEEITDKIVYETKMEDFPKLTIICSIIFVIISLINKDPGMISVAVILCGLFFLLLYSTRKKTISIVLYDNRVFIINQKKPNENTVKQFVDSLQLKVKEYLKSKYATIDKDLPLEPQLNNYTWLRNRDVINENEFNELKSKLLKNNNDNKIGFN